jgi:hypothetical protein
LRKTKKDRKFLKEEIIDSKEENKKSNTKKWLISKKKLKKTNIKAYNEFKEILILNELFLMLEYLILSFSTLSHITLSTSLSFHFFQHL